MSWSETSETDTWTLTPVEVPPAAVPDEEEVPRPSPQADDTARPPPSTPGTDVPWLRVSPPGTLGTTGSPRLAVTGERQTVPLYPPRAWDVSFTWCKDFRADRTRRGLTVEMKLVDVRYVWDVLWRTVLWWKKPQKVRVTTQPVPRVSHPSSTPSPVPATYPPSDLVRSLRQGLRSTGLRFLLRPWTGKVSTDTSPSRGTVHRELDGPVRPWVPVKHGPGRKDDERESTPPFSIPPMDWDPRESDTVPTVHGQPVDTHGQPSLGRPQTPGDIPHGTPSGLHPGDVTGTWVGSRTEPLTIPSLRRGVGRRHGRVGRLPDGGCGTGVT